MSNLNVSLKAVADAATGDMTCTLGYDGREVTITFTSTDVLVDLPQAAPAAPAAELADDLPGRGQLADYYRLPPVEHPDLP